MADEICVQLTETTREHQAETGNRGQQWPLRTVVQKPWNQAGQRDNGRQHHKNLFKQVVEQETQADQGREADQPRCDRAMQRAGEGGGGSRAVDQDGPALRFQERGHGW